MRPVVYELLGLSLNVILNFLKSYFCLCVCLCFFYNNQSAFCFQTTSEYIWTKREKAEIGTPLQEVINFVSI